MADHSSYGETTIHEFLDQIAKDVPPLPAGGSATALAGALAASLEIFVARLSLRKRRNPSFSEDLPKWLSHLEELQKKCLGLMDRDAESYERVIQAARMPGDTSEQESHGLKASREAVKLALVPPLELVECGVDLLRYGQRLVENGDPVALGDAGAAAEFARACLWGGLWICRINLTRIGDADFVNRQIRLLEQLEEEGESLYRAVRNSLDEKI
jgi:formiminotetrahydrofolate cyclodeaminase